jgi:hypothetical protein
MKYKQNKQTNKLHGLSPWANYTDRATAACRWSDCQICMKYKHFFNIFQTFYEFYESFTLLYLCKRQVKTSSAILRSLKHTDLKMRFCNFSCQSNAVKLAFGRSSFRISAKAPVLLSEYFVVFLSASISASSLRFKTFPISINKLSSHLTLLHTQSIIT